MNWQHQLCKNPRPNPDIKTLFVDHTCGQPNGARAPSPANNPLLGSLPKAGGFPPLGAHGVSYLAQLVILVNLFYASCTALLMSLNLCAQPFQPTPTPVSTPLWMSNPSTVTHPAISGGPIGLGAPSISGNNLTCFSFWPVPHVSASYVTENLFLVDILLNHYDCFIGLYSCFEAS